MTRLRSFVFLLLAALLVLCSFCVTQAQNPAPIVPNPNYYHYIAGMYNAQAYATWSAAVVTTLTGTGAQTYTVAPPTALRDGTTFVYSPATLFNTNTPLTFSDANSETVVPSSISIGNCPTSVTTGAASGGAVCISVTATFANAHGQGTKVISGDNGIMEAMTDAGNNGGGIVFWQADSPSTTLLTSGLTTTTATYVPNQYIAMGASAKVTTTITTSANWAVGISGATTSFCTANATLTAGTTCIANMNAPAVTGSTLGVTKLLYTMGTSNPGAGAIKARVWGYTPVQAVN